MCCTDACPSTTRTTLHAWFSQPQTRSRCLEHVLARAVASVELLSHFNVDRAHGRAGAPVRHRL
jgi:hypothetical protein